MYYEVTLNARLLVEPTITAKRWRIHRSISQSPSKWLRICLARSSYWKALGTIRCITMHEQEQAATTTQITRVTQHTARYTSHYIIWTVVCLPFGCQFWSNLLWRCIFTCFRKFSLLVKWVSVRVWVSTIKSFGLLHTFYFHWPSADLICDIRFFYIADKLDQLASDREHVENKCLQKPCYYNMRRAMNEYKMHRFSYHASWLKLIEI